MEISTLVRQLVFIFCLFNFFLFSCMSLHHSSCLNVYLANPPRKYTHVCVSKNYSKRREKYYQQLRNCVRCRSLDKRIKMSASCFVSHVDWCYILMANVYYIYIFVHFIPLQSTVTSTFIFATTKKPSAPIINCRQSQSVGDPFSGAPTTWKRKGSFNEATHTSL